jgi:thiol-disulfide isomerase/thioredoxin
MTRAARAALGGLLALALLLGGCSSGGGDDNPEPDAPQTLPQVTLQPLESGDPVDLSTLRGPLVVNVWASWCPPCRDELPVYQRFSERYAGRVDVVGIDFNDVQREQAIALARDSGLTYPLLTDPKTTIDGKGPIPVLRGLPVLILVDEQGHVVDLEYVEITSLSQLEALVSEHLGVDA